MDITIRKPDDWHVHLRDGAMLEAVLPFTAAKFGRAVVMPNLAPNPVITTEALKAYKERIIAALARPFPPTSGFASRNNGRSPAEIGVNSEQSLFTPLMTYYLTDNSSPEDIVGGFTSGIATAVKVYPAGATTNSDQGVTDIGKTYPVLAAMEKAGMPLLLHGEVVVQKGETIPSEDREKVFLDSILPELLKNFPELKIVLEHTTTKDAVDFVMETDSPRLASTITLHHITETKDRVVISDHPQYLLCVPVIKSDTDRLALRNAAMSGNPHFFLGTDSAPHPVSKKEGPMPPGGVFTAPAALELYAREFDEEGKLENLEAFASLNGPRFYGMEPNKETITLVKEPWTLDELVPVSDGEKIFPYGYDESPEAREVISWKIKD